MRQKGKHMLETSLENLRLKSEKVNKNEIISEGNYIYKMLLNTYKYLGGGAGLSAPQIGIRKCVFIWTPNRDILSLRVAINPILYYDGTKILSSESCYSLPGDIYEIDRYSYVNMVFYNLSGEKNTESFKDFEATLIQHEYDHLCGKLISDHGIKKK